MKNIPIPNIKILKSGDSYVLPSDFLKLYFSFGLLKPKIVNKKELEEEGEENNSSEVRNVWQTRRAKDCLRSLNVDDDNYYKIFMMEWSDAFDLNGVNKNNRGLVHVTTFSLFDEKHSNDVKLTFPASISNDKNDHREIRNKIHEDLS